MDVIRGPLSKLSKALKDAERLELTVYKITASDDEFCIFACDTDESVDNLLTLTDYHGERSFEIIDLEILKEN